MPRLFGQVFMEQAAGAEDVSGNGAAPTDKPTEKPSPNEGWQDDKSLDENGNPIEQPPAEDKPQEPEVDKSEPAKPDEEKTDDTKSIFDTPVVKQVESLLNDAGLNPQEVTQAIMDNDGKLTPALAKQLVEKHGEAVASIVSDQLTKFHTESKNKASERDNAVYSQVEAAFKDVTQQSGSETWKELSGWAKENVPNDERKEINKLLQQGGIAAKYAIDDLVSRFKSSDSFVQSAELVSGDNFAADNSGLAPLSKAEYTRKFRELESQGHVYGQSTELDKLDRQRTAGMQRGI